ncbi:PepSY domain-containing protein [Halomonas borealis]|uniref:PepSY domain-containing protein n=1 Tax=Halomonas borealis TaxID=2508710 RepID=UPI0027B94283|nr:PepSY domain-containing protein [Halomonas borealis]
MSWIAESGVASLAALMVHSCTFWHAVGMKMLSTPRYSRHGALAALLLATTLGGAAAQADDGDTPAWRALHEAVRDGRVVPLPAVLDWLQAHYRGQVLEVELGDEDGGRRYEIEMLGPEGQLVEFEFDAANGELMEIEGVNIEGMRRP